MNEGVKVLIERMKTNPEDFNIHPFAQGVKRGRFYWMSEEISAYLTNDDSRSSIRLKLLKQDDLDALIDAYRDMHQQEFTNRVMKDLFKEEEEVPSPAVAGGWMPQGQRASATHALQNSQNSLWGFADPRLAMQAQIDSTTRVTSVSNGGTTGTTASPWFQGLFK